MMNEKMSPFYNLIIVTSIASRRNITNLRTYFPLYLRISTIGFVKVTNLSIVCDYKCCRTIVFSLTDKTAISILF